MYSSVPTTWPNSVNIVFSVSRWPVALATPKSMTLGTGLLVVLGHQDVRRLEVAVDDALSDGRAAPPGRPARTAPAAARGVRCCSSQYSVIGTPLTSSITKYGRPLSVVPGIEHLGDVRMVHQRQRLPLGLEAGDHLPRVHARLDDLERDRPLDRLGLLGHEDDAHAAFADLLQQLVRADDRAGALGDGRLMVDGGIAANGRLLQEAARLGMRAEQSSRRDRCKLVVALAGLMRAARPTGRAAPCRPARQRCLWPLRDSVVMAITM